MSQRERILEWLRGGPSIVPDMVRFLGIPSRQSVARELREMERMGQIKRLFVDPRTRHNTAPWVWDVAR